MACRPCSERPASASRSSSSRGYIPRHQLIANTGTIRVLGLEKLTRFCQTSTSAFTVVDDCQKHPISGIHIPKAHGGETICSAAKIGGILVNDAHHANFLYDNLMIQANVVDAAYRCGVGKAMLLGSSYLHPKFPLQPIIEEARLPAPGHRSTKGTPSLDRGHQVWSGLSATALLRRDQRTMPTNLYGPGDKFDRNNSHVLPAFIRKAHQARTAEAGSLPSLARAHPARGVLNWDDRVNACVHPMTIYSDAEHIKVCASDETAILDLAHGVVEVVAFIGAIGRHTSKPEGTPRKLIGAERLRKLDWASYMTLEDGVRALYGGGSFQLGSALGLAVSAI